MNSGNTPRFLLARLIAVQVFIHACMAGLRLAAPLYMLRQGESALAVGALMSLFALTQVFLSVPAGRFADRHPLRRPVAISVCCAAGGGALAAAFPIYPVLCLAALLSGGATGCALIALQRHVGCMTNDRTQLKRVFSWLAVGPSISNFLGPFFAGLMIDGFGFRATFAALALMPLLSWLLVRGAPELPRVGAAASEGPRRPAWDLLRDRRMRRLLLINWLLSSCWDVHTFVLPVLGHQNGLSASAIGSILGAFAIAASAIRLLVPFVAERLQEWAVLMTAMAAAAILLGIYPLLSSALAMGACSVLLGLALGSVQPMILSTLHQVTPADRHGEALGLRMMTINASSVVMPMLFGTAGAAVGVAAVFWTAGAAVGLGTRAAWLLQPARANRPVPLSGA